MRSSGLNFGAYSKDSHDRWRGVSRGLGLFLGLFSLINLAGDLWSAGFDANLWWIDLRMLPPWLGRPFLLISGICLVAFAARPPRSRWRTLLTEACVGLLGLLALVNSAQFYVLLVKGTLRAGLPVPSLCLSLLPWR